MRFLNKFDIVRIILVQFFMPLRIKTKIDKKAAHYSYCVVFHHDIDMKKINEVVNSFSVFGTSMKPIRKSIGLYNINSKRNYRKVTKLYFKDVNEKTLFFICMLSHDVIYKIYKLVRP